MTPSGAVHLRRVHVADIDALNAVRLAPEQGDFVAVFADWPDAARDPAHLHVIERGGIRGFFRIDPAFDARDPRLPKGAHGLRGLLIDARVQGQGIGRVALTAMPAYIRATYPALKELWLTVDHWNAPAIRLYESTGWDGGVVPDFAGDAGPEPVFRLVLHMAT